MSVTNAEVADATSIMAAQPAPKLGKRVNGRDLFVWDATTGE